MRQMALIGGLAVGLALFGPLVSLALPAILNDLRSGMRQLRGVIRQRGTRA